jgi:hypothetical protein
MVRIKKNSVQLAGVIALFCISLACFTYINSLPAATPVPAAEIFVEEISEPNVLPDVELVKRIVRKAFEFMSLTNL